MAQIQISIPGYGDCDGEAPIVILGPNGSGKTQLAQKIAHGDQVSAISAQRRTWVNDALPVQEKQQLQSQMDSQQEEWRRKSWQPTQEIDYVISTLIQDQFARLVKRNDEAIDSNTPIGALRDSNLMLLQGLSPPLRHWGHNTYLMTRKPHAPRDRYHVPRTVMTSLLA